MSGPNSFASNVLDSHLEVSGSRRNAQSVDQLSTCFPDGHDEAVPHRTILAANTVYAAIYGSQVGNPYDDFGKISKQDLAFVQQVAQDTAMKYFGG
ncbi:MAG: hypothetical protein JXQ99_20055 [Hyphomicrobiaceae bacterium]